MKLIVMMKIQDCPLARALDNHAADDDDDKVDGDGSDIKENDGNNDNSK